MIIRTRPRENTARFLQATRDEVAVYRTRISPVPVAVKTIEVAAVDEVVVWRPVVSGPALVITSCGTNGRCADAPGGCPDHVGEVAGRHSIVLGATDEDGHTDAETVEFTDGEGIIYRELVDVDPWELKNESSEAAPWDLCCKKVVDGSCYLKLGHVGPCDADAPGDVVREIDDLADLVDAIQ